MQAIEVKETVDRNGNHRLRASCAAGCLSLHRDTVAHILCDETTPNTEENRAEYVAHKLRLKLKWHNAAYGKLICGQLKNGNYVFVFTGQQEIAHTGKEA